MGEGFLDIGKVTKPHGLRGQVKVQVDPASRENLRPGQRVRLGGPVPLLELEVETRILQGQACILGFSGVSNRQAAEALVGGIVQIKAETLPKLPDGVYYWHQVAGHRVVNEDGRLLGWLEDMFTTPAHDIWVARSPGQEFFLPVVDEVILSVNQTEREVRVRHLIDLWEGDDR